MFIISSVNVSAITVSNEASTGTSEARSSNYTSAAPVKFLAWDGNKLLTTSGAFSIDKSVKVVDRANSKSLNPGFTQTPPTVQLIFKDRKLVEVIIE